MMMMCDTRTLARSLSRWLVGLSLLACFVVDVVVVVVMLATTRALAIVDGGGQCSTSRFLDESGQTR